jgi:putative transposon-encoded protein
MRREVVGIRTFERTKVPKQYIGIRFNIIFIGHPERPIVDWMATPVAIVIRIEDFVGMRDFQRILAIAIIKDDVVLNRAIRIVFIDIKTVRLIRLGELCRRIAIRDIQLVYLGGRQRQL